MLIMKYNIITFIMSEANVPGGNNQRITGGIYNVIRGYQLCTLRSTSSCLLRQPKSQSNEHNVLNILTIYPGCVYKTNYAAMKHQLRTWHEVHGSNQRAWQALVTNHRGAELRVQKCSVELTSNEMLFGDGLVDMNRCIGLTRSKVLYPLRHEPISPAWLGFHCGSSDTYSVYPLFRDDLTCFDASWPFLSPAAHKIKNTEKQWGHTPGAWEQCIYKNRDCRP